MLELDSEQFWEKAHQCLSLNHSHISLLICNTLLPPFFSLSISFPSPQLVSHFASNTHFPQPNPPLQCILQLSLTILLLAILHLLHPSLTFTLSFLPHLSGIVNLSPFWHTKSLSWVPRRGGTAPAWIFQKAVILNMTLSSVLSLWSSILPCQTFLVRGLDGSYSPLSLMGIRDSSLPEVLIIVAVPLDTDFKSMHYQAW